jgi:multiple sugar transport system substrate-binding protein
MQTLRSRRGTFKRFISAVSVFATFAIVGCGGATEANKKLNPSFTGISLKVGTIGDPAILAGAKLQRGEWVASRSGSLEFVDQPVEIAGISDLDVVLFPGERMGDLIDAGALAVIPRSALIPPRPDDTTEDLATNRDDEEQRPQEPSGPVEAFQYSDIVPAFRDQVARYGSDVVGFPYGGSALVLVYRQDAFRKGGKNEAAAKEAGIELAPPRTWQEFEALARFFHQRDWDGDGKPDFGVSLPLGEDTDHVANTLFLARAAAPGQRRDYFSYLFDAETMAPRLETPPFVEALESLVALRQFGPPGIEGFDAKAAREAFRSGHVAMLIDRAEKASTWSHGKPIGVAPLPGSLRVFDPVRKAWEDVSTPNAPSYLPFGGGWLIGVRRGLEGTKQEAAIDFARFLADPENSNRIRNERSFAMLPFRIAQMGLGMPDPTSAPDVDVREWSDAVSRTLMAEKVVPGLRIPEAGGYLTDLTAGRVAAMKGEPVAKALANIAANWTKRTAAFGKKRQSWHYQRSVNSPLATDSELPPKGQ